MSIMDAGTRKRQLLLQEIALMASNHADKITTLQANYEMRIQELETQVKELENHLESLTQASTTPTEE